MPRSGGHDYWSADEVPDLAGKVIVVTGANSGIGLETAQELARKGAHTILACRSPERGQDALETLRAEIPHARTDLMTLNLAMSEKVRRPCPRLSVLCGWSDGISRNVGDLYSGACSAGCS